MSKRKRVCAMCDAPVGPTEVFCSKCSGDLQHDAEQPYQTPPDEFASGSGLLDLTSEQDDTQLEEEILNEIFEEPKDPPALPEI